MAFIKCSGGGKLKETILWENPNPSGNFAAQTITLNYGGVTHNISNFDYIRFQYIAANYGTVASYKGQSTFPKEMVIGSIATNINNPIIALGMNDNNKNNHQRFATYESDTQIKFTIAYASNTQYTSNTRSIPTYIYGLK